MRLKGKLVTLFSQGVAARFFRQNFNRGFLF